MPLLALLTMTKEEQINFVIINALSEDIGDGDHSTLSTIDVQQQGRAILKIKERGIIAGVEVAKRIFQFIEPASIFNRYLNDGDIMDEGQVAFEVQASVHTILKGERLVLNCMQRMSGIATLTHEYVQKLVGYHTQLLDTRKTTPNFRVLEKEAVRIGGALNHRFGLYDMIMLKDNHIDYCGGITAAIEKAYSYVINKKPGLKIEVETRSLDEVREVMQVGKIHRIMLDNFSLQDISAALTIINGTYETEASGGINLENLQVYAATGVDYISSGAIIHQAKSLDLSLKAAIK